MRNRAKCKNCNEIIESFHATDYVECTCKEISISGGTDKFIVGARDWANFLRIDDSDREIPVQVKEERAEQKRGIAVDSTEIVAFDANQIQLSRKRLLDTLKMKLQEVKRLPDRAFESPVMHYDYYSLLADIVDAFELSDS